jgi:hypothetical protein
MKNDFLKKLSSITELMNATNATEKTFRQIVFDFLSTFFPFAHNVHLPGGN